MPKKVVILQPMFIPWIGVFEQIRLADVYVHYDDVQMPQGRSFVSRVQIKTPHGVSWLTAPIDRKRSGKLINEVVFASHEDWRARHLKTLRHAYVRAPCFNMMWELAEEIYSFPTRYLAEFNINAIEIISRWLGFCPNMVRSSWLDVAGSGSRRLLHICKLVGADTYITGLGGLRYLNHDLFEQEGIKVCYMDYKLKRYPQLHGEFTPYVSILDGIANCGPGIIDLVCSNAVYWREYVENR